MKEQELEISIMNDEEIQDREESINCLNNHYQSI